MFRNVFIMRMQILQMELMSDRMRFILMNRMPFSIDLEIMVYCIKGNMEKMTSMR